MILCKKTNKTFYDFKQNTVYWSDDKLPVCPYCKVSPFDGGYYKANHETVRLNEGAVILSEIR